MKLTVNGEAYEHKGAGTIASLLAEMRSDPARVAVTLNEAVVPKSRRDAVTLREGDRVEILGFAGGG
jgi:sulfur carrier protein